MRVSITQCLLAALVLLKFETVQAQIILSENFDGVAAPLLPSGWATTYVEQIGFRSDIGQPSDYANASGANNVIIRNSDSTGTYSLYSPVINTLGRVQVSLIWASRVSNNFLTSGSTTPVFEFSADNGMTWIPLSYSDNTANSTWNLVNNGTGITHSSFDNQTNLQFRWTITIVNAADGTYRMDDFSISGVVAGCMDDTACNYNVDAQYDDGSCIMPDGCTVETACNYDPNAECFDGSCIYPGCTEPAACNYSPTAACSDSSCIYPQCTDPLACNYDSLATCPNGECFFPDGCNDILACNYNDLATCDDGSCTYPGCTDSVACNYNSFAACSDSSCTYAGCTDSMACNYDASAGCDDNSCILPDGCTDSSACNYDFSASCDNGLCIYPDGCIDTLACNFNALALCDDGSCTYPTYAFLTCDGTCVNDINQDGICDELAAGCSVMGACNYDSTDTISSDDVCYYPGCTDVQACNFNSVAACDDGSCEFPGCTNAIACNFDSTAGCDDGSCLLPGCTDLAACNYEASAFCDNATCVYPELYYTCEGLCVDDADLDGICDQLDLNGCLDSAACNYNAFAQNEDGSCTFPGCFNELACNYDTTAGCDGGYCLFPGCTDTVACNYESAAGCDNNSCTYPLAYLDCDGNCISDVNANGICDELEIGCTDSSACNYSDVAVNDDGSCNFPGCTDFNACNYVAQAGCPDSSCVYAEEYYDCLGNCINDINANGVCDEFELADCLDSVACNYNSEAVFNDSTCTYPGCMDTLALNYDAAAACADDSLCEYSSNGVSEVECMAEVFPVPVSDLLKIRFSNSSMGCYFRILDAVGSVIIEKEIIVDHLNLDLSSRCNGMYVIQILKEQNVRFTKKFIVSK